MKTKITKDQRRAAMYARIQQHGETLLDLFPNASERDPVKLCKKLRRLELKAQRFAVDLCNGDIQQDADGAFYRQWGRGTVGPFLTSKTNEKEQIEKSLCNLLRMTHSDTVANGFFINQDPRGYALKLSDDYVKGFNNARDAQGKPRLYTDWGGYGILAPDLSND
jgi:hypothetical protein